MTIHELANWQVCPNTGEPQTVYELNMVKMFIAFGEKVRAELEKGNQQIDTATQKTNSNGTLIEAQKCGVIDTAAYASN